MVGRREHASGRGRDLQRCQEDIDNRIIRRSSLGRFRNCDFDPNPIRPRNAIPRRAEIS